MSKSFAAWRNRPCFSFCNGKRLELVIDLTEHMALFRERTAENSNTVQSG